MVLCFKLRARLLFLMEGAEVLHGRSLIPGEHVVCYLMLPTTLDYCTVYQTRILSEVCEINPSLNPHTPAVLKDHALAVVCELGALDCELSRSGRAAEVREIGLILYADMYYKDSIILLDFTRYHPTAY